LAEHFVGQQLRSAQTPLKDPQLFYWQRTGGRLGEITFPFFFTYYIVAI